MKSIEWSTFYHAYGSAGDIPELLERLRTAPRPGNYRDEPWFSLWSALYHQCDVFTASYAAVPELIAIAEERRNEPEVSAECLYLAAMIELERGAHEGPTPPPAVPAVLAAEYPAVVEQGARLTEEVLTLALDRRAREVLEICRASFAGDFPQARLLADGHEY